jgi:hypothetical protein
LNQNTEKRRDLRYRAYVGPADKYDLISANQFSLLIELGLRDTNYLLDIGCGSLGGGRLFIPYLLPGHYFGIEPVDWLIQAGIKNEIGADIITVKQPVFDNNRNFNLGVFNRKFDFILAQSIFSHAAESQIIRRCVSEARYITKPSSKFVASFYLGCENYQGDSWIYPEFATYTLEKITGIFEESGFNSTMIEWKHPCNQKWLVATPIKEDD